MNRSLNELKERNPDLKIKKTDKGHLVTEAWKDETISFLFPLRAKLTSLTRLVFPPELVAIHHEDDDALEFIYGPIEKRAPEYARSFVFNYSGLAFECSFAPISPALRLLAKHFKPAKTETTSSYRNLRFLRDYIKDPSFFGEFMKDAEIVSFFVKGPFTEIDSDFVALAHSLNFYMRYFDRRTPTILVMSPEEPQKSHKQPCYLSKQGFPNAITAVDIDPTILEIFTVSRETESPRLSFIFYFQILEYCSYYYLNEKLQRKLVSTLRRPDVAANASEHVRTIIEDLKDALSQRDDSAKLENAITHCCSIDDVKHEIECNAEYFCKDVVFDGGLVIPKILKDKESIAKLSEADLVQIKRNIEKIRNVLVHLRESRENKVILPTRKNDTLIMPYLYCVRRLAEKVAIQFEK